MEDTDWSSNDEEQYSDLATEYGVTTEGDTDFTTDDEGGAFDTTELVESINDVGNATTAEGLQPYELFKSQRKKINARRREKRAKEKEDRPPTAATDPAGLEFAGDQEDATWMEERDRRPRTARRHGQGRRARKRRPTHISRGDLPPQGIELMQQANEAFTKGQQQSAVELLTQCIREYPNFVEPYVTLAAVFSDIGLHRNALNCYAIAAHMKPSDTVIARSTAQLSVEFQYYKQAIWAWARCIRMNRKDHEAHVQRLECYSEYIAQQEAAGKPVTNITRMAHQACKSMLRDFPDDPAVSLKMPVFMYKLGQEDKAVNFLTTFIQRRPEAVEPTHVNMLAQLLMERREFAEAVRVMETTVGLETCMAFVDLAVKMGVCLLHLGKSQQAMPYLNTLRQHNAADFHDLYGEVLATLGTADPESQTLGLPLCQTYMENLQSELMDAMGLEEAADGTEYGGQVGGSRARLVAHLVTVLPALESCCRAADDMEPTLQAYQLLRTHGSSESVPGFADHMMHLVSLLMEASRGDEAREVLAELEGATAGEPQSNLRMQSHVAESHLLSGDTDAFLEVMTTLIDGELRREELAAQSQEHEYKGIEPALRRRIERAKRKLAAEAGGLSQRRPSSKGGGYNTEDDAMFEHAELAPKPRKPKDRRKPAIRELDEKASQILAARSDMDTDAEDLALGAGLAGGGGDRLRALLHHPQLFDMMYKALELKADAGDCQWAERALAALLLKFKKRAEGEELRRKSALLMLQLHCRVLSSSLHAVTLQHEKAVFAAWPCSLRLWNTYSRWCQTQPVYPTRLVKRLRTSHPDSLPLMMLRGHFLTLDGRTGEALEHYFQAYEMLPDNAVINLHLGIGHLLHAMGKRVGERHACLLKAFAFLCRYASLHTHEQEAAYNIGRAMHQLGLHDMAVEWYERALLLSPAAPGEATHSPEDLRHEAAHNLCLIYSSSGAHALAAQVLRKYCVV